MSGKQAICVLSRTIVQKPEAFQTSPVCSKITSTNTLYTHLSSCHSSEVPCALYINMSPRGWVRQRNKFCIKGRPSDDDNHIAAIVNTKYEHKATGKEYGSRPRAYTVSGNLYLLLWCGSCVTSHTYCHPNPRRTKARRVGKKASRIRCWAGRIAGVNASLHARF